MTPQHLLRLAFALIVGFSLFATDSAHADRKNEGFSQLDFDRPPMAPEAPRHPNNEQLREILSESVAPKEQSKVQPQDEVSGEHAPARARLALPQKGSSASKFDWVKPEDDSHFLVPRLKGLFADEKNPGSVTTAASWKREGSACQDVTSAEGLCNKARALKEVTQRFTGNEDFYMAQCNQSCAEPAERAVLVGFIVKQVPEGDFRMMEENKNCRYQIVSNVTPPKWQMLQVERGTCQCLPKTCVQ